LKERRKFRRWDCLIPCRFEGEGFSHTGLIVDLSCGGAGIKGTDKLPAQGTELLVEIGLPWNKIQLCSGVVWVKTEGQKRGYSQFRVEFLDTLPERQQKLANFFPKNCVAED
jgi:hypothetical protein